jgi:hypothetical protein
LTTVSAKVLADSVGDQSKRLTTFELEYPRWIHAEGRTHRVLSLGEEEETRTPSLMEDKNLSRNASSSRAIPVERLIKEVMENPAVPLFWGANQRGMQGGAECNTSVGVIFPNTPLLTGMLFNSRENAWLGARDQAVAFAKGFSAAGYHKQIVNRLLEPFSHIKVVVTATQWSNFFALRRHEAAEPHIKLLADRMWDAMQASTPRHLKPGQWHLPYVTETEDYVFTPESCIKLSVARCASVSYNTVDGFQMTLDRAVSLHDKLVAGTPMHASPCEHQAAYTPASFSMGGNLGPGWVQYRKTLSGECL